MGIVNVKSSNGTSKYPFENKVEKKITINGKKLNVISAHQIFEDNTKEEIYDYFNGNGIDAKFTQRIAELNEKLKEIVPRAGRPSTKTTATESEQQPNL